MLGRLEVPSLGAPLGGLPGVLFTNHYGRIQVLPTGPAALVFEDPHVTAGARPGHVKIGLGFLAALGSVP